MADSDQSPQQPSSEVGNLTWLDRHLWQIQPLRDIGVIVGILLVFWLGYRLSIVTVPLLLAVALAYLFEPVVKWLKRQNIFGRQGSAVFIIAVMTLVTVVPIGVGGTFAVIEGVGFVSKVASDGQSLRDAIQKDNRDNEEIQARVTERPWTWILGIVQKEQDRQEALRQELEAQAEEEAAAQTLLEKQAAMLGAPPASASQQDAAAADGTAEPVEPEPVQAEASPSENTQSETAQPDTEQQETAQPEAADPAQPEPPQTAQPDADDAEPLAVEASPESAMVQTEAVQEPAQTEIEAPAEDQLSESELDAELARMQREEELRRERIAKLSQPSDIERAVTVAVEFVESNASAISSRVVRTGAGAFESFMGLITSFGFLAFTFFLTCFFFFFVSISYQKVLAFGESLIPDARRDLLLHLFKRFDVVVSGFIRGRLTIAFIQGIVFTIGYWIIGVPAPLLLGVGVAMLSIVPYAALVGIPVSILLLQLENRTGFRGEIWWVLGAPTVFYFIGQALDDYVWTPLIQGKSTGMDTPTILFATLAGGALLGVYGLLLAIPLAACIKILLQEIFWPRFKQWAAGERPDFLPIAKD